MLLTFFSLLSSFFLLFLFILNPDASTLQFPLGITTVALVVSIVRLDLHFPFLPILRDLKIYYQTYINQLFKYFSFLTFPSQTHLQPFAYCDRFYASSANSMIIFGFKLNLKLFSLKSNFKIVVMVICLFYLCSYNPFLLYSTTR